MQSLRSSQSLAEKWLCSMSLQPKDSRLLFLRSNIFTDQKITETYKELRGMISNLQEVGTAQARLLTNTAVQVHCGLWTTSSLRPLALEGRSRQVCGLARLLTTLTQPLRPDSSLTLPGTTSAVAQVYNPLALRSVLRRRQHLCRSSRLSAKAQV